MHGVVYPKIMQQAGKIFSQLLLHKTHALICLKKLLYNIRT